MAGKTRQARRRKAQEGPIKLADPAEERRSRISKRLWMNWLLSLLIGPIFGFGLSHMLGVVTTENWRVWLIVRVVLAAVWPLLSVLVLLLFMNKWHGATWRTHGKQYLIVTALLGFPAFNAVRDLWSGEAVTHCRLVDKELTSHYHRMRHLVGYKIRLSNGSSYQVGIELYDRFETGDLCDAVVLPHTDILLNLLPPQDLATDRATTK